MSQRRGIKTRTNGEFKSFSDVIAPVTHGEDQEKSRQRKSLEEEFAEYTANIDNANEVETGHRQPFGDRRHPELGPARPKEYLKPEDNSISLEGLESADRDLTLGFSQAVKDGTVSSFLVAHFEQRGMPPEVARIGWRTIEAERQRMGRAGLSPDELRERRIKDAERKQRSREKQAAALSHDLKAR